MHSTNNLHDGYIGSGKILKRSIAKYGKENHSVVILEHYFTREWLKIREVELVCAEKLIDSMCMNLKIGGEGGWDTVNSSMNRGFTGRLHSTESKEKISKSSIGKKANAITRKKISDNNKLTNESRSAKVSKFLTGRIMSDETKKKISDTLRNRVRNNAG